MAVTEKEIAFLTKLEQGNERWTKLMDLTLHDKTILGDLAGSGYIVPGGEGRDHLVARITPKGRDYLDRRSDEKRSLFGKAIAWFANSIVAQVIASIIVAAVLAIIGLG